MAQVFPRNDPQLYELSHHPAKVHSISSALSKQREDKLQIDISMNQQFDCESVESGETIRSNHRRMSAQLRVLQGELQKLKHRVHVFTNRITQSTIYLHHNDQPRSSKNSSYHQLRCCSVEIHMLKIETDTSQTPSFQPN